MRIVNDFVSPNFAPNEIPVDFVILHYTAADLRRTMDIFGSRERGTCAHFVLDTDGTLYDLGGFWEGPIRQGAHAGESRLEIDGVKYAAFNKMSIGVEIINVNGNLFPYTEEQYRSLHELLAHLMARFSALKGACRIVGHEQIAGFRGKCDPGIKFDWTRVLGAFGLPLHALHRETVFSPDDMRWTQELLTENPVHDEHFWSRVSSGLEARIKERQQG